ncbi:MAG: hypothetical protein KDD69_05270 [Bdellovibrionales bacterium]|nr:hypothetical protein [Bdellovibrionales bacterium]
MPMTLLKPHLLSAKNRLIQECRTRWLNRDVIVILVSILVMVGIYLGTSNFLRVVRDHPAYDPLLPARLLGICFLAFFLLLLFSNTIAALGYLFSAQDLPLLLTLPIRRSKLYFSRLVEILLTSSWMFLLFSLPALFAFSSALELPWEFLPLSLLLFVPFLLIPAALGSILVILFVNIISPHRIRDLLVLVAFALVITILYLNHGSQAYLSTEQEKLDHLVQFLYIMEDPQPVWSPAKWLTDILAGYLIEATPPAWLSATLLVSTAIGLCSLGYLLFDTFFQRGWSIASNSERRLRVYRTGMSDTIGRILIPFNPQLRAICYKEARTFIRDTVQSLQLLMLLMLTFIYLYNFRALRIASQFDSEGLAWWQVILSIANVAFGACVVSAIATRFVFPSLSLEGRAYILVRCSPLSIEQLLQNKFRTWLLPIGLLAIILLVSGTWAIQATLQTVVATALIAIAVSIGIVGLAVGVGAVYARFDWESPTQVTASFGSLVYMLLALGSVITTIVPVGFMFVLTSVPGFIEQMSTRDYRLAITCSLLLVFFINYAVAKRALAAGAQRLRDMER